MTAIEIALKQNKMKRNIKSPIFGALERKRENRKKPKRVIRFYSDAVVKTAGSERRDCYIYSLLFKRNRNCAHLTLIYELNCERMNGQNVKLASLLLFRS